MRYTDKRVRVTGGYVDSEYTLMGYGTGETYPGDTEMHLIHLDSGSYHYYLAEQIEEFDDSEIIK